MNERKKKVIEQIGILTQSNVARGIFRQIAEAPSGISAYQIKKEGIQLPLGKSFEAYSVVYNWISKMKTCDMVYRRGTERTEKNGERILYSPTDTGMEAYKFSMDYEKYLQEILDLNQRALTEVPGLKESDIFLAALNLKKRKNVCANSFR